APYRAHLPRAEVREARRLKPAGLPRRAQRPCNPLALRPAVPAAAPDDPGDLASPAGARGLGAALTPRLGPPRQASVDWRGRGTGRFRRSRTRSPPAPPRPWGPRRGATFPQ